MEQYYGTGRRKSSIARVYLRKGNGNFSINEKNLEKYFVRETDQMIIKTPLILTEELQNIDVIAFVKGGGSTGQAGALKHGISRALIEYKEKLRPILKSSGFLTRDARKVERKKYGRKGARAKFQFSKR